MGFFAITAKETRMTTNPAADRALRTVLENHNLPVGSSLENRVTWRLHRWHALDQCQYRVGPYRLDYAWPNYRSHGSERRRLCRPPYTGGLRPGSQDLRRNFDPTNPGETGPRVRWLRVNPHGNPAGVHASADVLGSWSPRARLA